MQRAQNVEFMENVNLILRSQITVFSALIAETLRGAELGEILFVFYRNKITFGIGARVIDLASLLYLCAA